MTDRNTLKDLLARAEEHVRLGTEQVKRQRWRVSDLERDGHDAHLAKQLLRQFEDALHLHEADRDRLLEELGSVP